MNTNYSTPSPTITTPPTPLDTPPPSPRAPHASPISTSPSPSPSSPRIVTGLFRDRDSAERAYRFVTDMGYDNNNIDIVMSEDTQKKYFADNPGMNAEVGSKASEGAVIGGAIGAIAAAISAIGTALIIPAWGLVIAGPVAAAIAGAGAGGVTGGLIGALVGWGMPEDRIKYYDDAIRAGGILIGIKPRNEEDARRIEWEWKAHQGEHVFSC